MFTGLIESTALLRSASARGDGRVFEFESRLANALKPGASIAVNGCCLTVETTNEEAFTVFATPETLARTNLGQLIEGQCVNFEQPLAVGDRLGGHFITGHVDALGEIARLEPLGESWLLQVRFPRGMTPWLVEKGSVAVDGISLTVFGITEEQFRVALIPETMRRTNLSERRIGDAVNLEGDLIGKYIARQIELRSEPAESRITAEFLERAGFTVQHT